MGVISDKFNENGRFNIKRVMKENQINSRIHELEKASLDAVNSLEDEIDKIKVEINSMKEVFTINIPYSKVKSVGWNELLSRKELYNWGFRDGSYCLEFYSNFTTIGHWYERRSAIVGLVFITTNSKYIENINLNGVGHACSNEIKLRFRRTPKSDGEWYIDFYTNKIDKTMQGNFIMKLKKIF